MFCLLEQLLAASNGNYSLVFTVWSRGPMHHAQLYADANKKCFHQQFLSRSLGFGKFRGLQGEVLLPRCILRRGKTTLLHSEMKPSVGICDIQVVRCDKESMRHVRKEECTASGKCKAERPQILYEKTRKPALLFFISTWKTMTQQFKGDTFVTNHYANAPK